MELKKYRKSKKLSQAQLGKMLNVSDVTIGKYEAGINEPNIETLKKMSKIFGVSIDSIVGNETDYFLDMRLLSEDCVRLIKDIANMPDSKIQKISGYVEAIKDNK